MTTAIKRRRGTTSEHSTFTGLAGEITIDTTKDTVVVHDGSTAGGFPLAKENNPTFTGTVTADGLTVDTDTLVVDSTNNKVGIGTSSPTQVFEVNNGSNTAAAIKVTNTSGYTELFFGDSADDDAGYISYRHATNHMALGVNAAERMRIDSSGNVGIGTSSPSNKLHVDGHIKYNGRLLPASTAADGTAGAPAIPVGYDYNTGFFRPTADTIGFSTNATERMRIDNSGNVGIGGTTTTGWANKQVVLDAGSNTSAAFVMVNDTTGRAGTDGSVITLSGSDMYLIQRESANMIFRTANTERMRIDSSGNVGIGTSSPTLSGNTLTTLNVKGNSNNTGLITVTSNDLGSSVQLYSGNSSSDNPAIAFQNDLRFGSATDAAVSGFSERMRIDGSSLSVAIGKTTFGTSGQGIVLNGTPSAPQQYFNKSQSGAINGVLFYHSNSYVGGINYDNTSTSFATSSDYRLKENVTDITDGIERVKQLNPSRFNFIADADRTVDGFIAHEAATVVPEAVTGEKDAVDGDGNPEYQGIDQAKLVPLLTAALQEAITKIEDLEARVATLEGN